MPVSDAEDVVTSCAYLRLASCVPPGMEQCTERQMTIVGTSSEAVLEAILPASTWIAGTAELASRRLAHLDVW